MKRALKFGVLSALFVGAGLTWGLSRRNIVPQVSEEPQIDLPQAKTAWPNNDFTGLEMGDRLYGLFNTYEPKLPFVKTIEYTARAPWVKGRSAWLSDYASYYKTSKHFIAHSLNNQPNYELKNIREGDTFNVLDPDLDTRFHLIVDLSRSHMWLYYVNIEQDEHLLLKNFPVGLGRLEERSVSDSLTPLGIYSLGERIGIYKPGKIGHYNGNSHEMIRTFGTRWIPFDKPVAGCSAPARGFGIHGCPWRLNSENKLVEERASLGTYQSDGCIQLAQEDMEKLFALIITRPTTIEIVRDFADASLPGKPAACSVELK